MLKSPLRKLRLAAALIPLMISSPALAATVFDATGDILPSFTGTGSPDLDVTGFSVQFNSVTSTFLLGNLLATHLKLRVVAVDANPDFGTLGRLSAEGRRCPRSLADLLQDAERLKTAAELNPYVSRQPSGLHLLAAPSDPELTASLGPDRYGELVVFLSCFYEVVLLDLGTGVAGPLARFALERADQAVLVTTPEWVTASIVLEALAHVEHDRTTVVLNKSLLRSSDGPVIEQRFRAQRLHRTVAIPYDEQLATTLDCGTYTLDALGRSTRVAIKQLGLAVTDQLV